MVMKRLRISYSDLELAFEAGDHAGTVTWYLDRDSGAVLMQRDDWTGDKAVEAVVDSLSEDASDAEIQEAMEKIGLEDDEETLFRIKLAADLGDYVEIPTWSSRESWSIMEEFVRTIEHSSLRERLERAIQGRGAFRFFRDTLADHPQEEKRWGRFQLQRHRELIEEWLESIDVAPEWEEPPPVPLEIVEEAGRSGDDAEEQFDQRTIEEVTMALLWMYSWIESGVARTWKGYPWDVMNELHDKGWISQPRGKAKSVSLTEEGQKAGRELAERHFKQRR